MSLGACFPGLEASGKLPADMAAEARALYDEKIAEYVRSGSREAAEALASADVVAALERQVTRKAFHAGLTIKRRSAITADLKRYNDGDGSGPIDPRAGPGLLDQDPRARSGNVEARRKVIVGQAHRLMDRVLAEHSANLLGQLRNKAQLGAMVRELFGEGTGDRAAAELAGGWRQAAEMLRRRFNAAGGAIGFRADWGLPQSHDWRTVRKAGFDAWRAFILPRLDPAKMIDNRTGQAMTAEALERALPEIFDTIRSNGWSKRSPGAARGQSMANRHGDERFLVFRDAQAWTEYAEAFGSGTPYDAMMGHIERMAREIAAMEILGPNPQATIDWLKGTLVKDAATDRRPDSKGIKAAENAGKLIDNLWDEYRGRFIEPRSETMALVFSSYRSLNVARYLGGAFLSATSDFAFTRSRVAFNGLSQRLLLPQYLKLFRPGSIEDQRLAVRLGLIAEEWGSRTAAQSRFMMEELTGEIPRRLAEGVMRASLLSRHTQAMRWTNGMLTLNAYTDAAQRGLSFDALDPRLRGGLQRYGLTAADWERMRSAPLARDRGADWIDPFATGDDELGSRFMEMVVTETDLAVPVADLKTRAVFNKNFERGTVIGEMGRGTLQFLSFGISVTLRQSQELLAMSGGQAARYASGLIIGTTLMGGLAIQLKEIAKGRDPRPMGDEDSGPDPSFWGAALAQGGGFGIFGDFFASATSRTGGGPVEAALGPLATDVTNTWRLAHARQPEGQLVRNVKSWLPGNNLWYARLAFDRMMADQAQEAIDPDYRQSYRRLDQSAADYGTDFWWRPGETAPARAPDWANALQEGPQE